MKLIRISIIIIASIALSTGTAFTLSAQETTTTAPITDEQLLSISSLSPGDYARMVLPPLSYLLETAANSPKVSTLRATKEEASGILKTVKRNWLNSFFGFGTYQYGQYGADVYNTTSLTGVVRQYTSQAQSVYSTGIGASIPLELFFDRKNKIYTQQTKIKQLDYQITDAVNEQKMRIAETYSIAVQQLAVLKIKADLYTLSNSSLKLGETEYLSGNITLAEFKSIKSEQAMALISYESTRAELNKAILFLEIMTGVHIIKKGDQ